MSRGIEHTPDEIAYNALELSWLDVESQAREVCRFAATKSNELEAKISKLRAALKNVLEVCVYSTRLGWDKTVAEAEQILRNEDSAQ